MNAREIAQQIHDAIGSAPGDVNVVESILAPLLAAKDSVIHELEELVSEAESRANERGAEVAELQKLLERSMRWVRAAEYEYPDDEELAKDIRDINSALEDPNI